MYSRYSALRTVAPVLAGLLLLRTGATFFSSYADFSLVYLMCCTIQAVDAGAHCKFYMYVCMYIHTCIHYIYTHIYICVCVYIYMYIY